MTTRDDLAIPAAAAHLVRPGRRALLRVVGLSLAAAATSACSGDDDDAPPPDAGPGTDGDERPALSGNVDLRLTNTALSLELVLMSTYQALLDSPLLSSSAVAEAATRFRDHHIAHRDVLFARVQEAGEEPFAIANPAVRAALVDPILREPSHEGELVSLLHQLELDAAQLYVFAAAHLTSPDLRATALTIGGVESRHATVLAAVGELDAELPSSYPQENPLPSDAIVPG